MSFFEKLHELYKWSILRQVGASKFASAVSLVPLLGYLVIFNEQVLGLVEAGLSHTSSSSKEESSLGIGRIAALYVGLVIVGVASVVFRLLCPKEIFESRDFYEHLRLELDAISRARFKQIKEDAIQLIEQSPSGRTKEKLSIYLDHISTAVEESEDDFQKHRAQSLDGSYSLGWEQWLAKNRDIVTTSIEAKYLSLDIRRPAARGTVALLYVVGFAFCVYPTLGTFVEAIRSFFTYLPRFI